MKDEMIQDNELLVEENGAVPAETEELVFRRPQKAVKKKRRLTIVSLLFKGEYL